MNRPKVLVVDDEHMQRKVFVKMLKRSGYGVFETERPEKVLESISKHEIDIVLLDTVMPGTDGFKCLEEIRKEQSKLPVILMSSSDLHKSKIKILEKEGITHFRKPIQREQLDSLIKKVLNEANGK